MNARAKEQKNALANAWGVADPEPFEDYGFMVRRIPPTVKRRPARVR